VGYEKDNAALYPFRRCMSVAGHDILSDGDIQPVCSKLQPETDAGIKNGGFWQLNYWYWQLISAILSHQ